MKEKVCTVVYSFCALQEFPPFLFLLNRLLNKYIEYETSWVHVDYSFMWSLTCNWFFRSVSLLVTEIRSHLPSNFWHEYTPGSSVDLTYFNLLLEKPKNKTAETTQFANLISPFCWIPWYKALAEMVSGCENEEVTTRKHQKNTTGFL